ncbi:hypothetical protein D9M72_573310 [compost metagenome]
MQVDHHEEGRGAGRVHVAHQPAPGDFAHDVFHAGEGHGNAGRVQRGVGLVVHHQEDAGDDLDHQHQQRQRTEEVPEVEVLRRVVLGKVVFPQLRCREAGVDPAHQAGRLDLFFGRHDQASPFSSLPITILVSVRNW